VARANVLLTNGAEVNVASNGGGSIAINAQNIDVFGKSSLRAGIISPLAGAEAAQAGDVTLSAKGTVRIENSFIYNVVFGSGKSGSLSVDTGNLMIQDGKVPSGLRNQTADYGAGGKLTIDTRQLIISNGSWLTTSTVREIPGGDLIINATDSVELSGISPNNIPNFLTSGTQGPGNAGKLAITTKKLMVSDGGIISAGTSSSGNGGELIIKSTDSVELVGTLKQGLSASQLENIIGIAGGLVSEFVKDGPFPSGVISGSVSTGNAGNLSIETGRLLIQGGAQASVSAVSAGDAGELNVRASSIELSGTSLESPKPSDIIGRSLLTTAVGEGSTAKGGNITVKTNSLTITDGAALAASTSGQKDAGDITISAESINLTGNGSVISAETTGQGAGGNLTLTTGNLAVQDGGKITVSSTGSGRAGDLKINANSIYLNNAAKITADT
ncbi:hypothetical protein KBT16_27870, partial [Nostoc sp. CCCryo 231-06]|nr:hypothetical protein [Nostoc sp. CCCryo 231-06]